MTRRQHGFTLIETLVAVALLALIAAASVPILRGSILAQARVSETSLADASHAGFEHSARLTLGAALHLPGQVGFEGDQGSVSFFAQPDGSPTPYRIVMSATPGGMEVVLTPIGGGASSVETFEPLTGFAGLYYFGTQPDGRSDWSRNWTAGDLPRLVVFDFEPGQNARSRRIEIAVGGQAGLGCDYDSGLQACREGI